MKLAVMPGDMIPAAELRPLGFEAMQVFFSWAQDATDEDDPTAEEIVETLRPGGLALAAMTLHVDLVGAQGAIERDVERATRCVEKTAALLGHARGRDLHLTEAAFRSRNVVSLYRARSSFTRCRSSFICKFRHSMPYSSIECSPE